MSGWRAIADEALQGRDKRDNRDASSPNGPSVPSVPVSQTLKEWHRHLSALDHFTTPPGWEMDAWLKLLDDAFWLYENHASYAVRNGWSALDLWGVRVGMPKLGGLADLIDGARNLKLSGGKAYWSHLGAPFSMNIGCGQGCKLLWELEQ